MPGTAAPEAGAPAVAVPTGRGRAGSSFVVELANFSGPFDLLLSLIAKHKLDVTEVALSQVTDEFVAHIRRLGPGFDLGQATEFLVIAATLLDLKAARLLPGAISDDEVEDLALLEARDLLFARLLQYKAYKEASLLFVGLMALEARHVPRAVPLEPRYAQALPEVQIGIGPADLARLAARLREPPLPPQVATDHVHLPRINIREHMLAVLEKLRELGSASFQALCADCRQTIEVVARFLALLELFREGRVAFFQEVPLGELTVRWVADTDPADSRRQPREATDATDGTDGTDGVDDVGDVGGTYGVRGIVTSAVGDADASGDVDDVGPAGPGRSRKRGSRRQ
ncbi:segregation and condensation protein A [Candidatus Protofrankia datiscae]|uniref:Segregation and condensation protein A n=1 Tax=Candidatus Protofrankia datiscae TaxID=2716812 RepID=F8B6E1_9ACTN|nr:segregation/condensation protein A [Candidatus Protofrankia datiscae]AEH09237.1 chromosome segregation and condensation protein ScpA [Candidatus Protofrankia datiscae]